jgi:hypothetical protein
MGSQECHAVRPGEEYQRERGPNPVADLEPGGRLLFPRTVGENHRDPPVGSEAEAREQRIGKLREHGPGIDQALDLSPAVGGRSWRTDFHLDGKGAHVANLSRHRVASPARYDALVQVIAHLDTAASVDEMLCLTLTA